jgi:serine protease Do
MSGSAFGRVVMASVLFLTGCGRGDAIAQDGERERALQEELGGVPAVVDTTTAASLSRTFRAAAATALPAVVTVQVTAQPQGGQRQMPLPFPFGNPQGEAPPQMGTGSGFVFTEDGHIITNNHVVESSTTIQVRFADGRIYDDIEVVGRDPSTDIAVIRIRSDRGRPFTALGIGDSDDLQVGDWVLALGNPLNLGFTVTAGIVSAKGRNLGILQGATSLESFIQTDAAINRGNSGGPLVDLYGRVVGVNTAISSPTGAYAGNGFAVPSALAFKVARDIVEYGHVRRPQLGVLISTVTEAQADLYDLDRIAGAYVSEVVPGGPADRAGLRPEDVIIALDGEPIESSPDLTTRLARRTPGSDVTLGVVRDGRRASVEVELGEFEVEAAPVQATETAATAESRLGLELSEVTPGILRELGRSGEVSGVVVRGVNPYGPTAGQFQPGDIILEFNRQRVTSVAEIQTLARNVEPGDVVVVRVLSRATGNEAVRSFRVRQ